jgi:hypothetical protein
MLWISVELSRVADIICHHFNVKIASLTAFYISLTEQECSENVLRIS